MRRKSKTPHSQQPQIQISFLKQNKQLTIQQNRLNVQILRVHTIQKQRMTQHIFSLQQQQLCEFFQHYQLFPYNQNFDINQLLSSNKLKLIKNQDKIYFGQVDKKQRQGQGINISKDGKIYEGAFQKNQKNISGIEIYPNGNLYLGEFQNNKKHGNGRFFWFSLSSKNPKEDQFVEYYEGSWWGGLPDGEGIHQKINGDFYTGSFKNGLKHNQGMQYFANGDLYKGQYINGLPQGYGEYIWSDKSYYKGDFKQGLRNGYGLWGLGDNSIQIYKGHYCMDKKSGYGVYQWQNGWVYKGNFDNDLRNGFGELYNANKLVYRGFWENGEQTQKEVINNQNNHKNQTVIKRNQSSEIYNRSTFSAQKSNIQPKLGMNTISNFNNRQQNPQKIRYDQKHKSTSKMKRKHQADDFFNEFGTIHHQADYFMNNRPQSFKSTITSANNQRQSLTDRKGFKSSISGNVRTSHKNIESNIGTSISKPLNRNFGTLYVPFQQNLRYKNRNMI